MATLGRQLRLTRLDRGLTQAELAKLIGLEQARISEIERGEGGGSGVEMWIALGVALRRPVSIAFSRPTADALSDAAHLAPQELILRLAHAHGIAKTFELPTRPSNPARTVDVGLRDDRRRVLSLVEISNRIDDAGQTVRDHKRKVAEAEGLAAVLGGDGGPYRVAFCWVLRDTAANRDLVSRYPHVFSSEFPGSSRAWARSLMEGTEPPGQPGLVWVDLASTRVFERRGG